MPENYIKWKRTEKPCLNHWYRLISNEKDYWQIRKDFHSPETNQTYYKIVEYYNGDNLYTGSTLAQARELMRCHTYRVVISDEL